MKKYNYIYLITNNINNRKYIGKHSTNKLNDGYMGSGKIIKQAITKEGVENFTKEIIAFADTEETLNWMERFYIKKFHTKIKDGGYNIADGGDGGNLYDKNGVNNPMFGTHRYAEANPMFGKHHSEETKEKIGAKSKNRQTFLGKHHSEESKQKMREYRLGKSPSNKGITMSEEQKQKLRKPHKKEKWLTLDGEVVLMCKAVVSRCHKDWRLLEEN